MSARHVQSTDVAPTCFPAFDGHRRQYEQKAALSVALNSLRRPSSALKL